MSKYRYRRASIARNTMDIKATSTSGRGEFAGLPNDTEMAIPVVATAQLVVASRRGRPTLLRYISPRYRWGNIPRSGVLLGVFDPGVLVVLIAFAALSDEDRFL